MFTLFTQPIGGDPQDSLVIKWRTSLAFNQHPTAVGDPGKLTVPH
jgi:hypothetical protein